MKKTAEEMFDNQTETFWDNRRQLYTVQKSDAISISKEYAAQFKQQWIDMPKQTKPEECDRIVVLFDNGEMKFYNDNDWPFAEVVKVFILPEAPQQLINPL
jgi:hypothetical protein